MQSHPDADAFVRAILRDPAELTHRLVFADWLEEQGGVPNLAWAYYIRLQIEITECEAKGKRCGLLKREATGHASYILGTATIPCRVVTDHHDAILRVLPASRYHVELGEWLPLPTLTQHIPITFGMGATVVPLSCRGRSVIVATEHPDHTSLKQLEREHHIEIIGIRASGRDLANCLRRAVDDSLPSE
jgi:uncharacterized protein (TIGR02996 family)